MASFKIQDNHLCLRTVEVGGQHDDAEGQDVGRVGTGEELLVGVAGAVARGKLLHESVNLLSLTWQSGSKNISENDSHDQG